MASCGGSSAPECGALRASAAAGRSRSYGSTARRPGSPACTRHLEHRLRPGDTLQGLALRYGVSTEQIKRINRLYTNDSIFLKETLRIPVAGKPELSGMKVGPLLEGGSAGELGEAPVPEQSASEFLRRLDSEITLSKAAVLKKLKEDSDRFDGGRPPACPGVPRRMLPTSQRVHLGPARLTKTARVTSLHGTEDQIFDL